MDTYDIMWEVDGKTVGCEISSSEDLHALARRKTKLSIGYIKTAGDQELLQVLLRQIKGWTQGRHSSW